MTPEPTATPPPEPTATATAEPAAAPPPPAAATRASPEGFLVTLFALLTTGLAAVLLLGSLPRVAPARRWRLVLWSWSAGWAAYVLYAAGAPGTEQLAPMLGWIGSALLAVAAAVAVLAAGLIIMSRRHARLGGG